MEQLAGRGMTSLDIRFVNPLCVLALIGCALTSLSAVVTVLLTVCWHLVSGADWRQLRGEALRDVCRTANIW